MRFLRAHFLTGLLVIAPTAITAYVVWWGFTRIDNLIGPIQKRYPIIDFPGIGVAIVLLLILVTGFLARNFVGRRFIQGAEGLLNRVPLFHMNSALPHIAIQIYEPVHPGSRLARKASTPMRKS